LAELVRVVHSVARNEIDRGKLSARAKEER